MSTQTSELELKCSILRTSLRNEKHRRIIMENALTMAVADAKPEDCAWCPLADHCFEEDGCLDRLRNHYLNLASAGVRR